MSLLIVEDDSSLRRFYEKALQMYGIDIMYTAEDGETAVDLYKSLPKKPDIIIMDYLMPGKNGLEATREILEMNKHQKIVVISGHKEIRDEALESGATVFEEKPISVRQLYDIINTISIAVKNAMVAQSC